MQSNTIPVDTASGMPDFNTVRQLRAEGHNINAIATAAGVSPGKLHGWYASQFSATGGKTRQFQLDIAPKEPEPVATVTTKKPLPWKAKKNPLAAETRDRLRVLFENGMRPSAAAVQLKINGRTAWGHYMVWYREKRAQNYAVQSLSASTAEPAPAPTAPIQPPSDTDALVPFIRRMWNGYLTEKGRLQPGKHLSNDDVKAMLTLFQ